MSNSDFSYCPRCGSTVNHEERFGKVRPVCQQCGWIHFVDPKVAAADVWSVQDGVLVCKGAPLTRTLLVITTAYITMGLRS